MQAVDIIILFYAIVAIILFITIVVSVKSDNKDDDV